jgi:hypothetical protein
MDLFQLLPHELIEVLLVDLSGADLLGLYNYSENIKLCMKSQRLWKQLFHNKFGEYNKMLNIDYNAPTPYLIASYLRGILSLCETDHIINKVNNKPSRNAGIELNLEHLCLDKLLSEDIVNDENIIYYYGYKSLIEAKLYYCYYWKLELSGLYALDMYYDEQVKPILFYYIFNTGRSWKDMYVKN